jgi:hypothetical protein
LILIDLYSFQIAPAELARCARRLADNMRYKSVVLPLGADELKGNHAQLVIITPACGIDDNGSPIFR